MMGSDLYACVECQAPSGAWYEATKYRTTDLARGPIVDFFGDCDPDSYIAKEDGYLTPTEWRKMQENEWRDCPWRGFDPYWVRLIPGDAFVFTVHQEIWRTEWPNQEPSPDLCAVAAMVESYLRNGVNVRVWCWHSQ